MSSPSFLETMFELFCHVRQFAPRDIANRIYDTCLDIYTTDIIALMDHMHREELILTSQVEDYLPCPTKNTVFHAQNHQFFTLIDLKTRNFRRMLRNYNITSYEVAYVTGSEDFPAITTYGTTVHILGSAPNHDNSRRCPNTICNRIRITKDFYITVCYDNGQRPADLHNNIYYFIQF